ncbi:hypothetical protein [uncultured Methanobrevibacter sp.]|uniref:hypothetical protein n=1 Tax=uncultured Methanobrevibacter sp. TaxID=253161 RepID=UPI0025F87C5E|nr:hypothetical protein [uncultured Methanobrevibacter sp.]
METYEDTMQNLNPNEIMETKNFLKRAFNAIKEKCIELKTKYEHSKYEKGAKKILCLMEEISNSLERNPLFKNKEFLDFLTIIEISEHILKKKELSIQHFPLIEELCKKFDDFLSLKLELKLNKKDLTEYNEKYEDFENFLFKKEEYFFLEICPYDGKERELIKKIANVTEGVYY